MHFLQGKSLDSLVLGLNNCALELQTLKETLFKTKTKSYLTESQDNVSINLFIQGLILL